MTTVQNRCTECYDPYEEHSDEEFKVCKKRSALEDPEFIDIIKIAEEVWDIEEGRGRR